MITCIKCGQAPAFPEAVEAPFLCLTCSRVAQENPNETPRVLIEEVADSYHDFDRRLVEGRLPMPCWIQIGDGSFRVTKENYKALSLGMLLSLEVRGHFGR